ncbi:MAG: tetratricopeptide repeat protein [Bacteroidales bacterium]
MNLSRFFLLPAFILLLNYIHLSANPYIDSLKRLEQATPNDSLLFEIQKEIAVAYKDSAFNTSMFYWKKALSTAEKQRNRSQMAHAFHHIGFMLYRQGEFPEALAQKKNALALYDYTGDIRGMGRLHNDIGLVYKTWGRYEKALESYSTALTLFDSIHDTMGWALVTNNIGQIYFFKEDYKKAIQHFELYLNYSEENEMLSEAAGASNNIAAAYMETKNFDNAERYYNKAKTIYDSLGIDLGVAILDDNIGVLYAKKDDYNTALKYHYKAFEVLSRLGSEARLAHVQKNLGFANLKLKRYPDAIKYLSNSKTVAIKYNQPELLKETYRLLSEVHKEKQEFENAYNYFTQFVGIRDSLKSTEVEQKLSSLEAKFEANKKTKELQIIQSKLQQQKYFAYILSTLIILFIFIIAFFIRDSYSKRKRIAYYKDLSKALTQAFNSDNKHPFSSDASIGSYQHSIHIASKASGSKQTHITFKTNHIDLLLTIASNLPCMDMKLARLLVISWLKNHIKEGSSINLNQTISYITYRLNQLAKTLNRPTCSFELNALLIDKGEEKMQYAGSNSTWATVQGKLIQLDNKNLETYSTKEVDTIYIISMPTYTFDDVALAEQYMLLEKTLESIYNNNMADQKKVLSSTIELMQESKGIDIGMTVLFR